MCPVEAGTYAEWAAALLTGGGLAAAVYQLREGRRERREADTAHQVAMARAVGISAAWSEAEKRGRWNVKFELLNASPYPISSVRVDIQADDPDVPQELVIGTVLPGDRVVESREVRRIEVVFGELTGGVEVWFSDVFGNHWIRSPWDLTKTDTPARIC